MKTERVISVGNIIDYIEWRGDLSFAESPFNPIDNLIFTQLSYFDFSGIVSENPETTIKLKDAYAEYYKSRRRPRGAILPEQLFDMLRKLAVSRRFSDLELSGYRANIDENAEKQFAAVSIIFEKKIYISFRGTDDTLVGWKEDFNLAFMDSIPAQKEAAEYLDMVMKKIHFIPVLVGGHSKGGNLAIYSALNCKKIHRRRIKGVYNYDGPGFAEQVVNSDNYRENEKKIINILPEGSVVGLLLKHNKRYDVIVKNTQKNITQQHNPFTWEVIGNDFIKVRSFNKTSMRIDKAITSWFYNMKVSEREEFVEALYDFLTASDAKTLTDIKNDKVGFIKSIAKLDKGTRKDLSKNAGLLIEQIAKSMLNK